MQLEQVVSLSYKRKASQLLTEIADLENVCSKQLMFPEVYSQNLTA